MELKEDNPFLQLKARSLLLWFMLISLANGLFFGLMVRFIDLDLNDPIMTYIIYCLSFGLLCLWVLERFHQLQINPRYVVGNLPSGYQWLPVVVLVAAIVMFSMGTALLLVYCLFLIAPASVESFLGSLATERVESSSVPAFYTILEVFSFLVVAPITEEFIFRGVILQRWASKWGTTPGIWFSSIVFGCLHVNPIGLSVFGIVMALLYLRTRTLIVPIIAHLLNNFLAILPQFLSNNNLETDTINTDYYLWMGLVFIACSAPFLIHFIYKKWPNKRVSMPYFANLRNQ
ncbi:MAG: CPBP family intramembrane metalloprotease [Symploca sp. SIO1C4]|uniref:CPBP family intramembrane metalloprotease n=1 Tax=Symploca sp. SIO1C4 TaxID=2607765 RepID=A0A6B3NJY0_9CYAN|nr:CPBP family intramembrane metalloprotease [Symploca sp. SIO1C4]